MKRKRLQQFIGQRLKGKGGVERFGCVKGSDGIIVSILLKDVYVTNEQNIEYVDHVWIRVNKKILKDALYIKEGDYITFTHSVEEYYRAPDFKKVQGFRLKRISDIRVSHDSIERSAICVKEFVKNMREVGKIFATEYQVV